MWMFAGLFIIPVITSAAAQSCPANQIASDAQIIQYGERMVPARAFGHLIGCRVAFWKKHRPSSLD